jgi:hypothetical protein
MIRITPKGIAVTFLLLIIALWTFAPVSAQAPSEYHGNLKTRVFHRPNCRYYDCPNCLKVFNSRGAAIEAGYRPCKVCNP